MFIVFELIVSVAHLIYSKILLNSLKREYL